MELSRPVHGGLNPSELRALGLRPADVLDFSASINPLGVSPLVSEALQRVDLSSYPDPDCRELREALSDHLGLEPGRILAGNGATELIHLIARSLLRAGDAAAILTPTFGEFEAACRRCRGSPPRWATARCWSWTRRTPPSWTGAGTRRGCCAPRGTSRWCGP